MNNLRPTLWRTCRVLANESRLHLLYLLLESNHLCNRDLVALTGMSEPQVSIHLRLLSSRGLIRQTRRKMKLLSSPEANEDVESAAPLLNALKSCHAQRVPLHVLFQQATAFTHPRRIEIIQKIPPAGIMKKTLSQRSGIPFSALTRHLLKLKTRGFATDRDGLCFPTTPEDAFSKALLEIILTPDAHSTAEPVHP